MGILFLGCKFWNILGINLCLDISTENYWFPLNGSELGLEIFVEGRDYGLMFGWVFELIMDL